MEILYSLMVLVLAQSGSVPAGSALEARLESSVHTSASSVGDRVSAVVIGGRGKSAFLIPEGTRLTGRVETIQPATRTNEGRVRLVFREMQFPDGRMVQTWITNSFDAPPSKPNRRYALLMGSGAAAGGLIGGNTARVAGILGGVLVGFVVAENSGNSKLHDLTLKRGQTLHLQLGEDLTLK
jgi:hypothetical protein